MDPDFPCITEPTNFGHRPDFGECAYECRLFPPYRHGAPAELESLVPQSYHHLLRVTNGFFLYCISFFGWTHVQPTYQCHSLVTANRFFWSRPPPARGVPLRGQRLHFMDINESVGSVFNLLFYIVGIALVIFWMVVAWRAMRAHERIADAWERANPVKTASDAGAVKPCVSCRKMIPKGYTKCLHCGHSQP